MNGEAQEQERGNEIFTITARRCQRCGGLLTSGQAIRDGYGACCLRKLRAEERAKEPIRGQTTLFDTEDDHGQMDDVRP